MHVPVLVPVHEVHMLVQLRMIEIFIHHPSTMRTVTRWYLYT